MAIFNTISCNANFDFDSIVKLLIALILDEEKGNVANKKRFIDEYSGDTLFMPKTNPKPDDYVATFTGNVEDNFKIGMAVTKKSIKVIPYNCYRHFANNIHPDLDFSRIIRHMYFVMYTSSNFLFIVIHWILRF